MKRYATGLVLVVSILAVLAAMTQATQIIYQSPKQMGSESSLIVRGKVTSVRSFWNDKETKIFTETMVAVEESFKGRGGGTVRILQLGGVVGNVRMHVHGALSWEPDEEVLLFLETYDADRFRVAGFSQGKFNIHRDPQTGEPFITRPVLDDAEVVGASGKDGLAPVSKAVRVPLNQFMNHALSDGQ